MRIIPFFNFFGLVLSDLSHIHIKMFYDYILEAPRLDNKPGKVSATTVHRVYSVFHKAMNQAVEDEYILVNPVSKAHPPREKVFHPQYYSAEQITTFIKHAKNDMAEIPLVLSFFFGTRRSETLGLKETAIDFNAGVIYISHTVTIGQRKYNFVEMDEQGLVKKAKLPLNRLHDARHSIASLMIQNGTDIRILQDYLGHSNIQTTTRYPHLKSHHLVAPANKVQELIAYDGLSSDSYGVDQV